MTRATSREPPSIVIVEDERRMRDVLTLALQQEGYRVHALPSGVGIDDVVRGKPDLIILDIMLPGADGYMLLDRIRALSEIPVLMLTACGEVPAKVRALAMGADDYVTKPFELAELIARVAAALRRPMLATDRNLRYEDLSIDVEGRRVCRGSRAIDLTPREFALLEILATTPERFYSKEALLERVWGFDFDGDPAVVDRYVSYLRKKLENGGEPRLIVTVRGIGYALRNADRA